MPEYTVSDSDTVSEVRDALAGISAEKIPDDTILFNVNNIAAPWVESQAASDIDTDLFEGAVQTYGAELSFASWFATSRMRDSELEIYTQPRVYRDKLEQRTDQALSVAGITRPPRMQHHQNVADPSISTTLEGSEDPEC